MLGQCVTRGVRVQVEVLASALLVACPRAGAVSPRRPSPQSNVSWVSPRAPAGAFELGEPLIERAAELRWINHTYTHESVGCVQDPALRLAIERPSLSGFRE